MRSESSNISDESDGDWETTSTTSTLLPSTTSTDHPPVSPLPALSKDAVQPDHTANPILEEYWIERAKFIKHLEKRTRKFVKRSKEDYDAARWGKEKPKKQPKPRPVPVTPPPSLFVTNQPAGKPSAVQTPSTPGTSDTPTDSSDSDTMFASTSTRGLSRTVAAAVNGIQAIPARQFSASSSILHTKPKSGRKKFKNPLIMSVTEAARVLRALEIDKPTSAYHITLHLKAIGKGNQKINVRGRVVLPHDHRKNADTILVFAEKGSLSARLAREAGVEYVGDQELIQPILDGEIQPTKVLSTPGMLGVITSKLARFLGPKGMMPTTRRGGVGQDEELVLRIQEAKGALDWIADSNGRVQTSVGRMTFDYEQVEANIRAVVESIRAGLSVNTNNQVDEHLVSRRKQTAKPSTGIDHAELSSSYGPPISLKDL